MAVKVEAFLTLEDSLTTRLYRSFRKHNRGLIDDAAELFDAEDFAGAIGAIEELTFEPVVEETRKYVELIGLQSVLYGASQVVDLKDGSFRGKAPPGVVAGQAELFARSLVELAEPKIRGTVQRAVLRHRQEQEDRALVQKAEVFTKGFKSFVNGAGAAEIQVGASLHNSRLSQFGFVAEAQAFRLVTYKINEQLDNRICPVCKRLHGQVFTVEQAASKLEYLLAIDDPADMAQAAPWPPQDKRSIQLMDQMTMQELVDRGWDTPPYHPLCRGQLQRTSQPYIPTKVLGDIARVDDGPLILTPSVRPKIVPTVLDDIVSDVTPVPTPTTPVPQLAAKPKPAPPPTTVLPDDEPTPIDDAPLKLPKPSEVSPESLTATLLGVGDTVSKGSESAPWYVKALAKIGLGSVD